MVMRGQFFIMGAIIILINLFILTHFITESEVSTSPPFEGAYDFVTGYSYDMETLFEDSPTYLLTKNLEVYRLISDEKAVWSYQVYEYCDGEPCSLYSVGPGSCGLNFSLEVTGRGHMIRSHKTFQLQGEPWWNDTWPERVGFTLTETESKESVNDTLVLHADQLPPGIWVNSTRIIGESEEPLWVNDTNSNDIIDGEDTLHFRYSLAPSGSRTYYLYYSTTGIWEMPDYQYSDSIAVLEDGFWGQGGNEVPKAAEFRDGLSGNGLSASPISADELVSIQVYAPKVLFLLEWERFPVFDSGCAGGCEGTDADIWQALKAYVLGGGNIVGVAGEGFCSPYHYSGGWQPYAAGSGEYAQGCVNSRLVPAQFSNSSSREVWGGDNQNISLTDSGASVFGFSGVIDTNCSAVVNTTGERWFTVLNSTGSDAAYEWSNSTSCISPGEYGNGKFVFMGTGSMLYHNNTHFPPFVRGLAEFLGARPEHVSVSFCEPQQKP